MSPMLRDPRDRLIKFKFNTRSKPNGFSKGNPEIYRALAQIEGNISEHYAEDFDTIDIPDRFVILPQDH